MILQNDPNALGNFNADEFMNMDMGNASYSGMMMDPNMGGGQMDPNMTGGNNYNDPVMMMNPTANPGAMPSDPNAPMGGEMQGMASSGDTVEYQGDYSRFTVKTYKGNSSDLAAIVNDKFSDLKSSNSMWVEGKTYTVVTDINTEKGLGTDLLVNVERIQFNDNSFNGSYSEMAVVGDQYWGGSADWIGTW